MVVRGVLLAFLMVTAVAIVLTLSWRSLRKEKARLLQDFAASQESAARRRALDLEDRLQDLEEDGRVIATLVAESRSPAAADAERSQQTMLASFRALATVVRHYRSLALVDSDGRLHVSAVDPSETKPAGTELLEMSLAAAADLGAPRRLSGPVPSRLGERSFYLYTFAVESGTIVITIEAPRFLQSVLRSVPDGHAIVLDRGGQGWIDCTGTVPCLPRAFQPPGVGKNLPSGSEGTIWLDRGRTLNLGLVADSAVATWISAGSAEVGTWKVLIVASATTLHAREQTLERQVLLTAVGLLVAIGAVGLLIVRQQRHSAALAERLRNTETLRALEGQLVRAEKLATTGVLAVGIAHEVGTPLGIIRARTELLIDELADHRVRTALDAIVGQIDRISSTIRQVLDFSRAQAVEVSAVDPSAALRSTLDLLDHRFHQQELQVHYEIEPEVPPIAADPHQLQQVLINLLLNACDACTRTGRIWITVRRDALGPRVRWEIRDNGSGIPTEHLLAVFDPFFTTKKRGEGTGLGLPVAASIVRNHGGEISLTSALGEGTTVTIVWPASQGSR